MAVGVGAAVVTGADVGAGSAAGPESGAGAGAGAVSVVAFCLQRDRSAAAKSCLAAFQNPSRHCLLLSVVIVLLFWPFTATFTSIDVKKEMIL